MYWGTQKYLLQVDTASNCTTPGLLEFERARVHPEDLEIVYVQLAHLSLHDLDDLLLVRILQQDNRWLKPCDVLQRRLQGLGRTPLTVFEVQLLRATV